MNYNNNKEINKSRRGRPEERISFEVDFIESEEGARRWAEILRLLEAAEMPTECSNDQSEGPEHEQLRLF